MRNPTKCGLAMLVTTAAVIVWAGFVAARGVTAAGQSQTAETGVLVRGIITDINDARIVGATLRFSRSGVTLYTNTNREGSYEIKLRAGSYDIQVNANGFQQIDKPQFEIRLGPAIELDFKMVVGMFIDPITVGSDLPEPTALRVATKLSDPPASVNQNSVYPPRYASIKTVQAWIPMQDGARLAVNLYMPDAPCRV